MTGGTTTRSREFVLGGSCTALSACNALIFEGGEKGRKVTTACGVGREDRDFGKGASY